jgi:hypothetical protein
LAQAAAVIVLNRWSYVDYRRRLDEVDAGQTLVRLAGAQHVGVLAATRLSLEMLQRQDPSGDAYRLLAVLSLLAPEGTSRAFLTALDMDQARLDRALSALINASLITSDPVIVTVHRLTAKVVRHLASDLTTQAAYMLLALAAAFEDPGRPASCRPGLSLGNQAPALAR